MPKLKIDFSIIGFFVVAAIAAAVVTLRSETYSIGYSIASLKDEERRLIEEQAELRTSISQQKKLIRNEFLDDKLKTKLLFPTEDQIKEWNNLP